MADFPKVYVHEESGAEVEVRNEIQAAAAENQGFTEKGTKKK